MRRFWSNEKGSMIVMFAVALVPVLALMGAAIDYSRASLARTKMQGALDATGLFLSRLPAGTTQEELNAKATHLLLRQLHRDGRPRHPAHDHPGRKRPAS